MSVNFYAALLRLDETEKQELHILAEEDEDYFRIREQSVVLWMKHLRRILPNEVRCRQNFIFQTVQLVMSKGLCPSKSFNVATAFALHLTDEVEARVRKIDEEVKHAAFN